MKELIISGVVVVEMIVEGGGSIIASISGELLREIVISRVVVVEIIVEGGGSIIAASESETSVSRPVEEGISVTVPVVISTGFGRGEDIGDSTMAGKSSARNPVSSISTIAGGDVMI
ncbi:unnamed protein product [Arabis nemorensis]|uniref:Uncharacterized protein n=1 Tax=Arabis nemorensis TaxID=586526 RepID=A0A565CTF3_9BRAS|nr:unnamed protein product [Arabis nemorensis]